MYFKPNKPKIQNIMDRLSQQPAIKIDSGLAQQLSRYNKIRKLRAKDKIYFGKDHTKNTTIVFLSGIHVDKRGNKYFFNGL